MKNIANLLLFIMTSLLHADPYYVVPFYGETNYNDAAKEAITNYGIYYQSNTTKALVEYNNIAFVPDSNNTETNTTKDFTQTNIAFSYNFAISHTLDLYTTLNYIDSSNSQNDGVYAILVGINQAFDSLWLGLDLSRTLYKNTIVDTVDQITPYITISYGDYRSLMGNYRIKLSYETILPNADANALASTYDVAGISLTQNKGAFQNSISYYRGEHIFALRNHGMNIQNLLEIYESSLAFSIKYNFSDTTALQASYIRKDFVDYNSTTQSKLSNISLFLYYKF